MSKCINCEAITENGACSNCGWSLNLHQNQPDSQDHDRRVVKEAAEDAKAGMRRVQGDSQAGDEQTETDELDEIVLKPAQWQYDDYLKAKADLESWSRQQTARLFDEIYELSPTKQFKDWKPQDAVTFYERLKALEALRVGLEGISDD